jgi:nucleotide-binding universal stress UspA family protein
MIRRRLPAARLSMILKWNKNILYGMTLHHGINFLSIGISSVSYFLMIKGGCMISKILVPTDGSKTAQRAAVYAVDLAKQLNASIIALSVIDKRMFLAQAVPAAKTAKHTPETVEDYLTESAKGYAGEIKKLCDQSGVTCHLSVKMGYPVEEIAKEAKHAQADLIVMGSRGRSALSATVLGSVSYGMIHTDKSVPVLLVRD